MIKAQQSKKKINVPWFLVFFFYLNTGCKVSGVFGINCDKPCPANCKENLCHIENGSCFGCKTGWTGKFCDTGI